MPLLKSLLIVLYCLLTNSILSQDNYGNQWILGRLTGAGPNAALLDFNGDSALLTTFTKNMEFRGSYAVTCNAAGQLLFYSNGCYIANAMHEMMVNGDSIGKGYLEQSYCKNNGSNPSVQAIISFPKPGSDHLYYLFYTDLGVPYYMQPFFPLAPERLFYALIDMNEENGLGKVIEKNELVLQDTFSRSTIQASRHANGKDWWLVLPKSHSNCYWTFLITENGVDTTFLQCLGEEWGDYDTNAQAVFSPDAKQYARANYIAGLNIFNFDDATGIFSNPKHAAFNQDTFYAGGLAFSPNSRFVYASCYTKLWQYDTWNPDISSSGILIGTLQTPPDFPETTHFAQSRLAPDGIIYIAGWGTNGHLHKIKKPNCFGLECGLEQYALDLTIIHGNSLPNMPHYKKWDPNGTCETTAYSIQQHNNRRAIRVYPSPASQKVNIDGLEVGDQLQWRDILGRYVEVQGNIESGWDISSLAPGFYWITVSSAGRQVYTVKLLKTNKP